MSPRKRQRIWDISQKLHADVPVWPGDTAFGQVDTWHKREGKNMKDFWKIAHKRACVIGFGLAVILGINVGFNEHARAQAKGCVIKNTNGVMSVANPRPVGANEVEFEDSVMGTQRMLYWPKKTLFCQNGAKTTVDKLSGQCQLKPAKKKNGGNNVWKLLCSGDKAASNKAGQRVERGPLMKGNNQDNMAKPKGTGFVMGQGGKPVLGQCNENDPNAGIIAIILTSIEFISWRKNLTTKVHLFRIVEPILN